MVVKAEFTQQGDATDPISPFGSGPPLPDETEGYLNISIRGGVGFGTVELQRKFPDDILWFPVEEFTESIETALEDHEYGVMYRLYSSVYVSSVEVRLGSKRD